MGSFVRALPPVLVALLLLSTSCLLAQPANSDCDDATTVCAGTPGSGNNTGANIWPGFCTTPPTEHVVWYTFTTNSQGGPVEVSISDIACPPVAGMDNGLSAVVFSGDGNCTAGAFTSVGDCQHDSVNFTITTNALSPQTQYWVVVAGVLDGSATLAAECGFSIEVGGPGADIIGVDFSAGEDVTVPEGANTQLLATGGTTYNWSPLAGLSGNGIPDPIAQPEETTSYTVTTQIGPCSYTDTVVISVERPLTPPNTITPNGDGINDTWEIPGIHDHPQATVTIYDRWGQRVFKDTGYKTPFDGKDLPSGTYYWVIELSRLEGTSKPITGYLSIVN